MLKYCKSFIISSLLLLQIVQACVAETNAKNSSDLYHGPGCDKMKFIGADSSCPEVGKFGIPGECTRYMDCVENAEGKTLSHKAYCPRGFNFDGDDCAPSANQFKCYQTDCILVSNSSEEESMEERRNITYPILNGTATLAPSDHNSNSGNETMTSLIRKLISLKRAPKLSVDEETWHSENNLTETETTTTRSAVVVVVNEASEEIDTNNTQVPNKTQTEVASNKKPSEMEIPVILQHPVSHEDSAATSIIKKLKTEIINTTATTFITTISTGNVSVAEKARAPFKATVSMVPLINGKVSKVTVNGLDEDYVEDEDLNSTTTSTTTTPKIHHKMMNNDTSIEFPEPEPEPEAAVVELSKNSTLNDATIKTGNHHSTENEVKIQKPTNTSTTEKDRVETPLNDTNMTMPRHDEGHRHDLPMRSTTEIIIEKSSTETTMETEAVTISEINPATETTTTTTATQPPSLKTETGSKGGYSDVVLSTSNENIRSNKNNTAEVLKARNDAPLDDSSMAKHEGHDPSQTQTNPKTMASTSDADRVMMLNALALPLMVVIAIFKIDCIIF